jgi:hypothetical protein
MKPTIAGGTQIGTTSGDFQNIKTLTGSAYLNAGTNWAYAVIDERGFYTVCWWHSPPLMLTRCQSPSPASVHQRSF